MGNNVTTTGTLASTVGSANPFRYKGYYFDEELNMYYCHTRYYMPVWCIWLNEDNTNYLEPDNINGMNLYQYCNNDPISGYDPNGTQSINMFLRNITNQIISNLIPRPIVYSLMLLHYNRLNLEYDFDDYIGNPDVFMQNNKDLYDYSVDSNYHQFTAQENKKNYKFVTHDGHYEVIYNSEGYLIKDERDIGTYNLCSPNKNVFGLIGHGIFDVVPWIVWGNSSKDTTNVIQRIISLFKKVD